MTESYLKFSIVVPTYNQGRYLERTIDSVLSQDYPNLELIVIDGASSDDTLKILQKYNRFLSYWESAPDRGQSHAINKGLTRATGDWLTWLNSDDHYLPGALTTMARTIQANPNAGVVVGSGRIVDQNYQTIHTMPAPVEINLETLFSWLSGGSFSQPSSVFSRKVWNVVGHIDEDIHIALDVDFWIRIAKEGFSFVTVDEMLSISLSHDEAKTTAFRTHMDMECALIIWKHGGETQARRELDSMANQLAWYRQNYETIVAHPVLRVFRPLIKRLAKSEDDFWREVAPPWVKS